MWSITKLRSALSLAGGLRGAILLATVMFAATAQADTLTVTNSFDRGAGSLRDAITHAKSGDTIAFDSSLNGQTITLTTGELAITKSLHIEGPGASVLAVSGDNKSRVFNIVKEGLTVTIAGLTITQGRARGGNGGGGILNVGSTLTLANSDLSCNEALGGGTGASGRGGGISIVNGANLIVTDSRFIDNQVIGAPGGPAGWGGGISTIDSIATVTRCAFTDNRAVGGDGGQVNGSNSLCGDGFGGAIANTNDSDLTVEDSTFTGNQAIGGNGGSGGKSSSWYNVGCGLGGGIANIFSKLVIKGSAFDDNQAIGGSNVTGSTSDVDVCFVGCGFGGGLFSDGRDVTVTNSTFDHNEALGGSGNRGDSGLIGMALGGGIFNHAHFIPAVLTASSVALTNNRAVGGADNTGTPFAGDGIGGGLGNSFGATATVSNCTFSGNEAEGGAGANGFGGGIFNDGLSISPSNAGTPAALTVLGSTITGNEATGGSGGDGLGGDVYATAGGDACADSGTTIDDVFGDLELCSE